jgi:hypothetical protein
MQVAEGFEGVVLVLERVLESEPRERGQHQVEQEEQQDWVQWQECWTKVP